MVEVGLMVNVLATDVPPPGVGLKIVTLADPAVVNRVFEIVVLN